VVLARGVRAKTDHAFHLQNFVVKVESEHVKAELAPMFIVLAKDDQDSVRLLCIENAVALAQRLGMEDSVQLVLPTVHSFIADKSWRVRYMVAKHYVDLAHCFGAQVLSNELVGGFIKMLKDPEAEVKTAAASKLTGFCSVLDLTTVTKMILPCIKDLVSDDSQHVRASLASDIMGLAPLLGKDMSNEYLLDLFLQLLKDDNSEVRLNIISKLEPVSQVIGMDTLSQHLLPAIVELAEDRQWRVRLAIIKYIPQLSAQLGAEFFNDKLRSLCINWLADPVFSIREAATTNLRQLTEVFGVEWARSQIIPHIVAMHNHNNYLHRMTTLFSIGVLADVIGPEVINEQLLPILIKLAADPVPNIRFNACKTFKSLIPLLDSTAVQTRVKPVLQNLLSNDTDRDVRFFAEQALSGCN